MQARHAVSTAFILFSFARSSFAAGPDAPIISVTGDDTQHLLQLTGAPAQAIFQLLTDPEVFAVNDGSLQVRTGYGVQCLARSQSQEYVCYESLSFDGDIHNYFAYTPQLRQSAHWIALNLRGPALEVIYSDMSDDGSIFEHSDGSLEFIKKRNNLSCNKTISIDGSSSFKCSQLISAGGLPIGEGTDPLIGSGTHPVVDASEGQQ